MPDGAAASDAAAGRRDREGRSPEPRGKHVSSSSGAAQVQPAMFHPHHHSQAQVPQTTAVTPDGTASGRQAVPEIAQTIPYTGGSPTGYDPATLRTF